MSSERWAELSKEAQESLIAALLSPLESPSVLEFADGGALGTEATVGAEVADGGAVVAIEATAGAEVADGGAVVVIEATCGRGACAERPRFRHKVTATCRTSKSNTNEIQCRGHHDGVQLLHEGSGFTPVLPRFEMLEADSFRNSAWRT